MSTHMIVGLILPFKAWTELNTSLLGPCLITGPVIQLSSTCDSYCSVNNKRLDTDNSHHIYYGLAMSLGVTA